MHKAKQFNLSKHWFWIRYARFAPLHIECAEQLHYFDMKTKNGKTHLIRFSFVLFLFLSLPLFLSVLLHLPPICVMRQHTFIYDYLVSPCAPRISISAHWERERAVRCAVKQWEENIIHTNKVELLLCAHTHSVRWHCFLLIINFLKPNGYNSWIWKVNWIEENRKRQNTRKKEERSEERERAELKIIMNGMEWARACVYMTLAIIWRCLYEKS